MNRKHVPRPEVEQALLKAALEGPPLLLVGPHSAGKSSLVCDAGEALAAQGWKKVCLNFMGAASSPERFVMTALDALPSEIPSLRVEAIRSLAAEGKEKTAAAVRALFSLWGSLDDVEGSPILLILDELTEIRSLAYFAGLREVHEPLGAALEQRRRGTLLASSYPTLAARLWPSLRTLEARPLRAAEIEPVLRSEGLEVDAESLVRATGGWPRYVKILVDRLATERDLVNAWAAEMGLGARLELACRHTYESLLLRSRGYGMSKAVMAVVAEEEGLNLTALVARLGRTPGAIRDYLTWLVGVDALRMVKKHYYYVDDLVRWWVRLYGPGGPVDHGDLLEAAREATGADTAIAPGPAPPLRGKSLIEID